MSKAEEILAKYPSVKLGIDEHYGKQTVLNALNEALRIHDVVEKSEQLGCQFCGTEDGKHTWTDDGEVCPLDRTA